MDHITTAYTIIVDRIRKSEGYVSAYAEVCSRVKSIIAELPKDEAQSVQAMRQLGGWAGIINRSINELVRERPELTQNVGSIMIFATVEQQLRTDTSRIRQTIQGL